MQNLLLVKQYVAAHFDTIWAWTQFTLSAAYVVTQATWTNRHEGRLRELENARIKTDD